MADAIVIIDADPDRHHRALEGLRSAVGLALAENSLAVFLCTATEPLPVSRKPIAYLEALRDLGVSVRRREPELEEIRAADAVIRWSE